MLSLLEGREHIEWLYLVVGVGQSRCGEIFNTGMLITSATLPGSCGHMPWCINTYSTPVRMRMGEAGGARWLGMT